MRECVKANGITFHIAIHGREGAPWLTFSNSHATDLSLWDGQAARFADRFRVLRYDTRGHGGSEATDGAYDFALLSADVVALWDALSVTRSHYVGLSLGGTTGIEIALRYPDRVASLTACDCRCSAPPEFAASWDPRIEAARRDGMEALVEPTLQRWFTASFRAANPPALAQVAHMIRGTSVSGYVGCAEALKRIDCEPRLAGIRCPTLFLTGEKDPSAPPDLVGRWCAAVQGAHFAVVREAAHITNIEKPAEFDTALERFLAKVA
ncbi:MAG TPA: alpha/beta fold hydrolase [Beijerinckiaceae bacterium]|jgi:3-oxoadipate enol-lactonase